ncbi:hypothetical protein CK203_087623 [Vitis vinifera]|uniref:Uncharacterized protein n=1 Tax=Vitis vinifera TaxID=29760 RepID=A0A438C795_VITVI|nr:hypothetical protein CK203_087623 [Vitis vinifera]
MLSPFFYFNGEFQNRGKTEHFVTPKSTCENFTTPYLPCKKIRNAISDLRIPTVFCVRYQRSAGKPKAPTVPSSKGGVPFSPPQRQYLTWRPLTSPPPEPSVHRITPKRARTSGPRETSRQSRPQPQAPAGSQHPSDIAPEAHHQEAYGYRAAH